MIKTWFIGEQFEVRKMPDKIEEVEFETDYYLGHDTGYEQSELLFTFKPTGEIMIGRRDRDDFIYLNQKEANFLRDNINKCFQNDAPR